MSQLLQKPYDCMACGQQIRISKIDGAGPDAKKKWNKFELDGKTPHICKKEKQQQWRADTAAGYSRGERIAELEISCEDKLTKEIAAIKAQLLVLVSRLDHIEAELQRHRC